MGRWVADVCSSASSLPVTGSDVGPVVLIGIALVVAGGALLVAHRHGRRTLSTAAMVLALIAWSSGSTPRADAVSCEPAAVAAAIISATSAPISTTTSTSTTTTALVDSSPAGVTTTAAATTVPTVLSATSTSSTVQATTTSTTVAGTTTSTTLAPPIDVPEVPTPALAGLSAAVVLLGARGWTDRRTRRATR